MKITKTQLKLIIKEELKEGGYAGHHTGDEDDPDGILARFNHREKVLKSIQALEYLKMRAREYHKDPTLNSGDIKALLQDDFMDSHYPKFFGIDEGEPSIAEFIEQFAVGQELNEAKKMEITKEQLKQIIKEELEGVLQEELPFGIGNIPSHLAVGAARIFGGEEAAYDTWKAQIAAASEEAGFGTVAGELPPFSYYQIAPALEADRATRNPYGLPATLGQLADVSLFGNPRETTAKKNFQK